MNELDFYNKNGYLKLTGFLDKSQIEKLRIEAKNIFIRQFIEQKYINNNSDLNEENFNHFLFQFFKDNLDCFINCGKQIQHLISLHKLSLEDKIIQKIQQLGLKSPIISTRPVLYFNHKNLSKEKVYHTVDAHQDWRSMQGSLNSMVVWIPLIDINKDLGALEIIPKSHLLGLRADNLMKGFGMVHLTEKEKNDFLTVEVEQGDILIFSSFLIHQSGKNTMNKPRWSCHFRYNDLDEPTFLKRKYAHPYLYKPIDDLITPNFPNKKEINKIFNNEQ